MTTADVWATLTAEERAMCIRLLMPSMRQTPRLLTLRYRSRRADLANREIVGPNAGRIAFARWLVGQGRMDDGV